MMIKRKHNDDRRQKRNFEENHEKDIKHFNIWLKTYKIQFVKQTLE